MSFNFCHRKSLLNYFHIVVKTNESMFLKKRKNKVLIKNIKMTPQENTPEVLSMKQKVTKIVM